MLQQRSRETHATKEGRKGSAGRRRGLLLKLGVRRDDVRGCRADRQRGGTCRWDEKSDEKCRNACLEATEAGRATLRQCVSGDETAPMP